MNTWQKTKFPGVRYRLGKKRFEGKPDRYYAIRYKRDGLSMEEPVGWTSEGITPQYAANVRLEIIKNIRLGDGAQSIKEKREIKTAQKREKQERLEAEKRDRTPFRILAEKYIEWSKTSKKSCRDDRSRYDNHIAPILGQLPIKDISVLDLERLKAVLKKKRTQLRGKPSPLVKRKKVKKLEGNPLSDATIKHVLVLVRQMFYKAASWKMYEGVNPVTVTARENKKFLKISDNKRERFLEREEAVRLLKTLPLKSQQLHDICLLGLYTGMRMGEIFNLRQKDIDIENEVIHIKETKAGEGRKAYMTPPIKKMFKRIATKGHLGNELIFLDRKGKKIIGISNTFDRVVEKLGFNKGVTDSRDKVVAHTLRHTFASWLAMAGEPILTIKNLMGHSDLNMTMRYAHLSPSHEREAVMRLAETKTGKVVKLKKRKG